MQIRPGVDVLPVKTRNELKRLRDEAGKWRRQFRAAQAELSELKAARADV